jgi:hypothetical protein
LDSDRMPIGKLVATREFDRPTVYIAGPMRRVKNLNREAFESMASAYRRQGWNVITPHDEDFQRDGKHWTQAETEEAYQRGETPWIRTDVEIIMALQPGRDAVHALPNWEDSLGASAEVLLAHWRGVAILGDGMPIPPDRMIVRRGHVGLVGGEDKVRMRPKRVIHFDEAAELAELAEQKQAQYDPREQDTVIRIFSDMLRDVTRDGGRKRATGVKPPWWSDDSHEAAIFSHLMKWKKGEMRDKDSNAHPLVHLAWRALAIAYRETFGPAEPTKV